jgi:hypothetical protein
MPLVSVFMDVEDPINLLADQAALDLAALFTEVGVRGSFCLTGEKCRTLVARGRQDVLNAYRPHCLGLHTDTHSYHPTTMELLADVSFEEGRRLAIEAESRGFQAFRAAFDRDPVFWGGAGNTWSPEITDALKQLGIPAYCYALTSLPSDAVHRFNGVIALPQTLTISEPDWADSTDKPSQTLEAIRSSKRPWLGIFVGHPTRFRYTQFWDFSFAEGKTPDAPEKAHLVEEAVYQKSLENLRSFLMKLKATTEIVGVDDFLATNPSFRRPNSAELDFFRLRTTENLRGAAKWPIHRPGLDAGLIVSKTLELEDTLDVISIV